MMDGRVGFTESLAAKPRGACPVLTGWPELRKAFFHFYRFHFGAKRTVFGFLSITLANSFTGPYIIQPA